MAASGKTPIQLYRTTTAGAAPSAVNLAPGELAININDADMALYAENASGTVKRVMNNPAGLKYPTADGTNGQVIKTDGAGTLSWVTPAVGDVTLNGVQTLTNKTIAYSSNTLTGVAPTASPTFTGTMTAATSDLVGPVQQGIVAVAAATIDCSVGNYFTKTASGALTWTFTNVPASRSFAVLLELTNGGTGAQTWPASMKWPGGTAPTLTASGVDMLGFITDDGGTTWRGVQLMKDSK